MVDAGGARIKGRAREMVDAGCEDQRPDKQDGGRKGCEEILWNNNRNHPPWIVTLG